MIIKQKNNIKIKVKLIILKYKMNNIREIMFTKYKKLMYLRFKSLNNNQNYNRRFYYSS